MFVSFIGFFFYSVEFFLGFRFRILILFDFGIFFLDEVGIDGWNEFDGEYAFVYTNPKKGSKKFLVKCLVMNDKLLVDAIADGGAEPAHLEIEYISLFSLLMLHHDSFYANLKMI